MMSSISLLLLLLLLPHCGGSIQPKKIVQPITHEVKERIAQSPHWVRELQDPAAPSARIREGITVEQAIALGIEYNANIQALFDDLGIKKADLIQAGFYTNPRLESVLRIPRMSGNQTNIELSLTMKLSDVWKVPLRTKIAQDELERKTFELLDAILRLRSDIQTQCALIFYHTELVQLTERLYAHIVELRNATYTRYQFGYASDLDKHIADMHVGIWQAKIRDAQRLLTTSYTLLYDLLGASVTTTPITLTDHQTPQPIIVSLDHIEKYALTMHPRILRAQSTIARARHTISYERSRIFDDVEIGFGYERDFEKGVTGMGPVFNLTIPFFNQNYGAIEHAQFEKNQAEKLLIAHQRMLHVELLNHYTNYCCYVEQINQYETIVLPATAQGIAYSKTFSDRMQLSTIILFESEIKLYEQAIDLVALRSKAVHEYIALEQTVGAALDRIPADRELS